MNKLMYASGGAVVLLFLAIFVSASGCANQSAPTTNSSDAALNDPMNYKTAVPSPDSISDPHGMKKDMNDVFNP